jgi:hypothetical protein
MQTIGTKRIEDKTQRDVKLQINYSRTQLTPCAYHSLVLYHQATVQPVTGCGGTDKLAFKLLEADYSSNNKITP